LTRRESASNGSALQVTSESFAIGAAIPARHSEYADGLSPQLTWPPVAQAKSYALIMEDPDARPITPFVHWVAWNIPADVTSLPVGLQEEEALTEPEGMKQGRTSRGSIAYFGPRPPVGDPAHHYHVQVFALDRVLDIPSGSDRDVLLAAMKGHVLSKGEIVGTFEQRVAPLK
jgi:Raf kinase inhibitor-like YbhB/YbcL family protein